LNAICFSKIGAITGQTMPKIRVPHPAGCGGPPAGTIAQASLIFGSNVSS
jgi:hypothetical protein